MIRALRKRLAQLERRRGSGTRVEHFEGRGGFPWVRWVCTRPNGQEVVMEFPQKCATVDDWVSRYGQALSLRNTRTNNS